MAQPPKSRIQEDRAGTTAPELEAPVCEVECVHPDVVSSVQAAARDVAGASQIFGLLADQTRLTIVYALAHSELCVCDVAAVAGVTTAAASYHLRLLHRAGVVEYRRDGRLVYYRVAGGPVRELVELARKFAATEGCCTETP